MGSGENADLTSTDLIVSDLTIADKAALCLGGDFWQTAAAERAGRNFGYFREDPHLSGRLGAGWVDVGQSRHVGTSPKH